MNKANLRITNVLLPRYAEELKRQYEKDDCIPKADFANDTKDQQILIALVDGKAAGFLSFFNETGLIRNLFVGEENRREGIASQLLHTLVNETHLFPYTLKCPRENRTALDFFRKHGFIITDSIQDGSSVSLMLQLNYSLRHFA